MSPSRPPMCRPRSSSSSAPPSTGPSSPQSPGAPLRSHQPSALTPCTQPWRFLTLWNSRCLRRAARPPLRRHRPYPALLLARSAAVTLCIAGAALVSRSSSFPLPSPPLLSKPHPPSPPSSLPLPPLPVHTDHSPFPLLCLPHPHTSLYLVHLLIAPRSSALYPASPSLPVPLSLRPIHLVSPSAFSRAPPRSSSCFPRSQRLPCPASPRTLPCRPPPRRLPRSLSFTSAGPCPLPSPARRTSSPSHCTSFSSVRRPPACSFCLLLPLSLCLPSDPCHHGLVLVCRRPIVSLPPLRLGASSRRTRSLPSLRPFL
ncbi:hypothetical protein B0H15DRAFT_377843 [Mycena belliarum]|uniref:Uncharacterized protein n=1 Tax=Mycena belliarum TaxID=1033014 RepID=A0AAD6XQ57_9AGAR|nr:hypothetical protein B0H15DRAFT_377843 [Mycena belliae]